MCVWHRVGVYMCVCVCLADCSTQSSDIPPDSSELFTVPGLSESDEEREREGERGEVRRGRGKPRQKVGLCWGRGVWGGGLSVSL